MARTRSNAFPLPRPPLPEEDVVGAFRAFTGATNCHQGDATTNTGRSSTSTGSTPLCWGGRSYHLASAPSGRLAVGTALSRQISERPLAVRGFSVTVCRDVCDSRNHRRRRRPRNAFNQGTHLRCVSSSRISSSRPPFFTSDPARHRPGAIAVNPRLLQTKRSSRARSDALGFPLFIGPTTAAQLCHKARSLFVCAI